MVKVTVLYNLPSGTDEADFVQWRMTAHHAANISRPGVVRADFYRILGTPAVGADRPAAGSAPFRFLTESYWESVEAFESSWNDPMEQARLVPAVAKISDALFLVSEELQIYIASD